MDNEEQLSIGALIVDLCEMLRPGAERLGKYFCTLPGNDILVNGSVGGGYAALYNALEAVVLDAIHATSEGSAVTIAVSADAPRRTISVTVSDQRENFSAAAIQQILGDSDIARACAAYRESGGYLRARRGESVGLVFEFTMPATSPG